MKSFKCFSLAASFLVLSLAIAGSASAAGFSGGFVPSIPPQQAPQQPAPQQPTPQQFQDAQKIFNQYNASMEAARQQLAAKQYELNALLSSPKPDKDQIQALSREIGELRGQMLANRADVRAQLQQRGLPSDFYGNHHGYRHHSHGPNWGVRQRGYARGGCGCW